MKPFKTLRTVCEWDIEMLDPDGCFKGHIRVYKYSEALEVAPNGNLTPHIVLVCDDSRHGRSRAYVVNGVLPAFFTDLDGLITIRVPERFHKEVSQSK